MTYQLEHTDTFGGEANYCWVHRDVIHGEFTNRQLVRKAKAFAGITGIPSRVDNYGDTIAIYPRGLCQVVFVSYIEE